VSSEDEVGVLGRARKVGIGLALLVAGIVAVGGACSPSSDASGEVGSGRAAERAVEVVAGDQFFEPDVLEIRTGTEVTIEVTNTGDMPHDFSIEELDVNTGTIEPGEVATATFTVPDKTIEFVCSYHSDMRGEIRPE
jgi:plastocyanin